MNHMPGKNGNSNQQASPLLVGLLILSLVVVVAGGGYLLLTSPDDMGVPSITVGLPDGFRNQQQTQELPADATPTPEQLEQLPEEIRQANSAGRAPLPSGRQRYSISSSGTGPKFTEAVIDPLDAEVGQQQTLTVKTQYGIPVQSVVATLITDGDPLKVDMQQVGTEGDVITWQATWTLEHSYEGKYGLNLNATAQDGQKSRPIIELYFR